MPDASPNAFSTHTRHVAYLLKVVTAQLPINLMKNCFDKLLRRGRDDVQTLGSLGALDRLDFWNINDFLDSLQLGDLDCLLEKEPHVQLKRRTQPQQQVPRVPGAPQSVQRRTQP